MNSAITPEVNEVLKAFHYRPAVSIILPIEPKLSLQTDPAYLLNTIIDQVEKELSANYPAEVCSIVMRKLRYTVYNLKLDPHKKSIAIYVSMLFQKVIFLDVPVKEKIIIDGSFEIRDLVYNNKQQKRFLLLLLSARESRMYAGDPSSLAAIEFNIPPSVYAYLNDAPEKVYNFAEIHERQQMTMYKFLYRLDSEIDKILSTYHLPMFVIGAEKLLGHFKKFTKHTPSVIAYINGNFDDATINQLKALLIPHIAEWRNAKQQKLLAQLEIAAENRKLVSGMEDVWRQAMHCRGSLLVVEKNYKYAARYGALQDWMEELTEPSSNGSYIRDAVDDVIEKILTNGGDVEFADDGLLDEYDHIALMSYH